MSSVVRQYYVGSTDGSFTVREAIGYRCTQQITIATSHSIDEVRVYAGENCAEDQTLYCDICTSVGGNPGAVLGTASVGADEIGIAQQWISFIFSPTVNVWAGSQYCLVFRSSVTGIFSISHDNTSPTYSGGQALWSDDSGSTWKEELYGESNIDISFYEYGELAPPEKVITPTPLDAADDVALDQKAIGWVNGGGATSYNVYYGVSEPLLTLVSTGQAGTSFLIWHIANGSPFSYSTSRTWRIDAVNDAGTTTGDVWTFTAINGYPDIAANPDPADEDTDVDIDGADDTGAVLTWDVSTCAKSYDVYFGTDPTPDATEFIRNQHGTTYNPGTLSSNTTYYWRIDAQNDNGTTTGSVWSFTTESSP